MKSGPATAAKRAIAIFAATILWGCGQQSPTDETGETQTVEHAVAAAGPAAVDSARIANADAEPHNWLTHGRTYSEQRYSPLDTRIAAPILMSPPTANAS